MENGVEDDVRQQVVPSFSCLFFFLNILLRRRSAVSQSPTPERGRQRFPFYVRPFFFAIFLAIHPLEKNERKTNQINGLFTTRPFPCSLWYDRFFFYLVLPSFTVLHWLLFGCPSLPWFD